MYRPPIEVLVCDMQRQIAEHQDEQIYKAVVSVGINVDKEELIRALQYDRNQYAKGHFDGVADSTPRWIPVTERLPDTFGEYIVAVQDAFGKRYSDYADFDLYKLYWRTGLHRGVDEIVTHWMPLPEPPKELDPAEGR